MIAKICGITRIEDARHAVAHGAGALGFVFWPGSPRHVEAAAARRIVAALPESVLTVGVFVNQAAAEIRDIAAFTGITTIQLHGDETPDLADALGRPVWRALSAPAAAAAWQVPITILLDAHDPVRRGGTGHTTDWRAAAGLARDRAVVLAGGLTPDNVTAAIRAVRPYGVDVSSGVESAPGVKDPERVARFLAAAQAAFDADS